MILVFKRSLEIRALEVTLKNSRYWFLISIKIFCMLNLISILINIITQIDMNFIKNIALLEKFAIIKL